MLSPEQAYERLKSIQNPQYQQDQLKRIMMLGGNLSALGQILIQVGPAWNKIASHPGKIDKAQIAAFNQLGKLKSKPRQKLFKALLPRIFLQVESTWNLFDILPYQTIYYRRPFRNPNHSSPFARIVWLQRLIFATRGYDQDVIWFSAWAAYLGYTAPDALGYLFAGAIEAGGSSGQEVFEILVASANGSHEIGVMGRHVVRGLLCAGRPDGWEFIERLLLAAQREEGLRQVILECVDEAHPQAFRRLLHVILEHNFCRFSAAMRAFNVWFGLAFESAPPKTINHFLASTLCYLDNSIEREKALREGTAQEAYYALWAIAFDDALAALPHAVELRRSHNVERRFAATHILAQMDLVGSFKELLNALEDPDLRIAARAVSDLTAPEYNREVMEQSDLFERLERLIARLPHKENTFKPLVWEWFSLKLQRTKLAGGLIESLGSRSPKRLIPYLSMMEPVDRSRVAELLKELGKKDTETRQVLLTLAGDPSSQVREKSLAALHAFNLTESETEQLESLLTRQSGDLRRGVIRLLLGLPDGFLLQSAERLLGKKNENQRRAGLDLLRESIQSKRGLKECRRLAAEYKQSIDPLESEARVLEEILAEEFEQASLDNALGLMEPQKRSKPIPPRADLPLLGIFKKAKLGSKAAVALLKSLDDLVEEHRTDPVEIKFWEQNRTELLGNIRFGFPHPDPAQPLDQDLSRLPLKEVWEKWWQTRPASLRDTDGFEVLRALAILSLFHTRWVNLSTTVSEVPKELQGYFEVQCNFKLNYQSIVSSVLMWLIRAHPLPDEVLFLLDALEASVSRIPYAELTEVKEIYPGRCTRSISDSTLAYLQICRWHRSIRPEAWKDEHHTRLWAIVRWLDEPKPGILRRYPQLEDALNAWRAGAATRDDLLDLLLGPREVDDYGNPFTLLRALSGRKPHPYFTSFTSLKEMVDACRERILSIETRRGDLPTAATLPALALRSVPGMHNLYRLLAALGKTDFNRGYSSSRSREAVLSHLIRITYPIEEDTQQGFVQLSHNSGISERRLVELAMYAPQWSGFVEATLGWPKFREAVFWVYAHTKDRQWVVEQEIRELWAAEVSEYTPLSADSLMDGAVDVTWFHQIYGALGEVRWKEVYRAAIFTASGNGHTRARLFANAMLGKLSSDALIDRITRKRHQDSLRALGLIPLSKDDNRQNEILRRYEVMQEFLRASKKFGSQRQASEKLAVAIGMQNLARTAGYTDPQRLEWAMEDADVADLANGPIVIEIEDIDISLFINDLGETELTVTKCGKLLKSIPAKLKKDAQISGLLARKKGLDRQASRMRQSLERAMCQGDNFTGAEINFLFRHPVLRAMLEQLIFIGQNGIGYPIENGKALFAHSGRQLPVAAEDRLRIAHPMDLLESGEWHLWQHECFIAERIQPFKQVFRELYVLTSTEKEEGNLSRRYAGQQVNPRQALALFGARGWVSSPGEGVYKTFHDLGISARVGFLQGAFTPAEVEGLTLETVVFTRRGEWSPLALDQISPRVFSEVMRDLDLVVSVAHAGGIDPEASASSIEARSTLVQETCSLLNIQNVMLKNNHVLIAGKLGNYAIHLGSAVVHKQPGGSLCIVPVHSQQRGRLFLPFVDNDPKTAEVISKVVLLARDNEIKDPTILEQIL